MAWEDHDPDYRQVPVGNVELAAAGASKKLPLRVGPDPAVAAARGSELLDDVRARLEQLRTIRPI